MFWKSCRNPGLPHLQAWLTRAGGELHCMLGGRGGWEKLTDCITQHRRRDGAASRCHLRIPAWNGGGWRGSSSWEGGAVQQAAGKAFVTTCSELSHCWPHLNCFSWEMTNCSVAAWHHSQQDATFGDELVLCLSGFSEQDEGSRYTHQHPSFWSRSQNQVAPLHE